MKIDRNLHKATIKAGNVVVTLLNTFKIKKCAKRFNVEQDVISTTEHN